MGKMTGKGWSSDQMSFFCPNNCSRQSFRSTCCLLTSYYSGFSVALANSTESYKWRSCPSSGLCSVKQTDHLHGMILQSSSSRRKGKSRLFILLAKPWGSGSIYCFLSLSSLLPSLASMSLLPLSSRKPRLLRNWPVLSFLRHSVLSLPFALQVSLWQRIKKESFLSLFRSPLCIIPFFAVCVVWLLALSLLTPPLPSSYLFPCLLPKKQLSIEAEKNSLPPPICVCVSHLCMCVYTCVVFISGPWQENLQHRSSEAIYLASLLQVLSMTWSLPASLLWVVTKNPAVSVFPEMGLQVCTSKPSIFTRVLEFEHRSCL